MVFHIIVSDSLGTTLARNVLCFKKDATLVKLFSIVGLISKATSVYLSCFPQRLINLWTIFSVVAFTKSSIEMTN